MRGSDVGTLILWKGKYMRKAVSANTIKFALQQCSRVYKLLQWGRFAHRYKRLARFAMCLQTPEPPGPRPAERATLHWRNTLREPEQGAPRSRAKSATVAKVDAGNA